MTLLRATSQDVFVSSASRRMNLALRSVDVVVPCHNEAEALPRLHRRLAAALDGRAWRLIAVDDGSTDGTDRVIRDLAARDARVLGIQLSRNFGHQAALSAGLAEVRADGAVLMDADGQDPPEVIPQMFELWEQGFQVVYGVRARRKASPILDVCYRAYYHLLRRISDVKPPLHSGDFCLLDAAVIRALRAYPERKKYWRGLRTLAGFRQIGLPYDRPARREGTTKYGPLRLVALAADGVFNMSFFPLRLIAFLGAAMALGSFVLALAVLGWYFSDLSIFGMRPRQVGGWTSLVVLSVFLSGVQFLSLGLIGEYIARMYLETKQRPEYHIASRTDQAAAASPTDARAPTS